MPKLKKEELINPEFVSAEDILNNLGLNKKQKNMKIKSLLKSIASTALKRVPVAGVIIEAKESMKEDTPHSPKGKIDWAKVSISILTSITLIAYIFGYITEEKVKFVMDKIFKIELFH